MLFITPSYGEAFKLLVESRNYMAEHYGKTLSESDRCDESLQRLEYSCESSRHTTRLLEIMAWLMIQRAVQGGEISLAEASKKRHRLMLSDVCLKNPNETLGLPEKLVSLSQRSYRLYLRLARLDGLLAARNELPQQSSELDSLLTAEEQLEPNIIELYPLSQFH